MCLSAFLLSVVVEYNTERTKAVKFPAGQIDNELKKEGDHFKFRSHFQDIFAHSDATVGRDNPNLFIRCCVKLRHLHGNKRPRDGRACPGGEGPRGQERMEPSGQAGSR